MMFAVIRLRGEVHVRRELRDTLEMLGLFRPNHLALKPETRAMQQMLKKVEPFIAFGEIDEKTLVLLLEKRGRLSGDKKIDAQFLKKHGLASFPALAKKIMNPQEERVLEKLGIKKVFRLHAPSKGFERNGIKKLFSVGGAAGYRSSAINALIQKMM